MKNFKVNLSQLMFLAWTILVVENVIAQDSEPLIQANTTLKLTDSVYVIPDNFIRLVPNVGIVVGEEATLIIDTGLGPRNGAIVLEEARRVSKNNSLYVVATHFHPEHTLGVEGLGPEAIFIAPNIQAEEMKNGDRLKNQFARRSTVAAELLRDVSYPTPDILFDNNYVLDLGGLTVRLIQTGPLHTRGDTLILIEEESVLFSGDVLMQEVFPSFDAENGSYANWLRALDEISVLNPEIIVGAHGGVGEKALVSDWKQLLTSVAESVGRLKAEGLSQSQASRSLLDKIREKYPQWRSDARRINAAVQVAYREY